MTATPSTASSGESVTISFLGELSEDWLHGADASLEYDDGGEWRNAWALISPDFNATPTSLVVGLQVIVPAIGFPLTSPTVVELTPALPSGRYRLCQGVVRTASSAGGLKQARACAGLQIV